MDTTETKRIDYSQFLAMTALVLIAFGAVFVCSTQANIGYDFSFRRVYFSLAGAVCLILFSFIPYKWFAIPSRKEIFECFGSLPIVGHSGSIGALMRLCRFLILPVFMLAIAAALVYVLFGPVRAINASRRWLILFEGKGFELSIQPSELVKLAVVFFLAGYTVHFGDILRKFTIFGIFKAFLRLYRGQLSFAVALKNTLIIIPFFAVPAFFMALIAVEDFGTAAFIAMLTFFMLFVAQTPYWILLAGIVCGSGGAYFYISQEQYRINRMIAFMDLEKASEAIKYQIVNSMTAISTGGIFGKGLGRGVYKWGYLPEHRTDFIFSIICEELGVVGAGFVILMFLIIFFIGFSVAIKCDDLYGKLLAMGLSFSIALQAFVNIGVVTSSLPTTGIPLPFVSAGGSSLITSALAIGLLMNIARCNANSADKLSEKLQ